MEIVPPFITVRQASASYPVYVGRDLLGRVGELAKAKGRVFVITSHALRERFGHRVAASFTPRAEILSFEEGEDHKTLATASDILTQLLDRGAKRDAMGVVVGGGMIGDTAGFAASIFLRGIDLVHVPTTLLAQVDSSLGGKLAVNHEKGKNLIGSFYPPRAVVSDLAVLDTLPPRERLSGLFEALKGGVIGDPRLFELLERPPDFDVDAVVLRAIRVKGEIVSADEKEADLRRLLNYGHTIGHGIEAATSFSGEYLHGEAVSVGMMGAARIAVRIGMHDEELLARQADLLRAFGLPLTAPGVDPHAVLQAMQMDKKVVGGHLQVEYTYMEPPRCTHCEQFLP